MFSEGSRATRVGVTIGLVGTAILIAAFLTRAPTQTAEAEPGLVMDLYLIGTDLIRNATDRPGAQNYIAGDLYAVAEAAGRAAPKGDAVGRAVGQCTVITADERICSGVFNLDGRGTITVQLEVVDGRNQGVAITGGTREFAGARGTIVETAVPGRPTDRLNHVELTTMGG